MLEASVDEPPCVIDLLVEPHDSCDVVLAEIREIRLWGMKGVTCIKRKEYLTLTVLVATIPGVPVTHSGFVYIVRLEVTADI